MITLYFAPTPNGRRAAVILAEAGLRHVINRVDFANKPAELLHLNPSGHIPVIVDEEGPGGARLVLAQSAAIISYVAEKAGRFWPSDPRRRATALQWLMQGSSDIAGASASIFIAGKEAPEPSQANVRFFEDRLLAFFRACDIQLEGRDYLADELSVADFGLYPYYAHRKTVADRDGKLHNLTRWGAMMAARPGVQRGMQPQP
jgi:GST-like protein